jgi:hypothetical protein
MRRTTVPDDRKPSPDWTIESVLKRLEETTPPGQPVSAQIFLEDTVSADELSKVARRIVEDATKSAGEALQAAKIGKVHRLARSFSVSATTSVIRQMSGLGQVKAVLPSDIGEDVLIKPVKKTPVP